MGQQQLILIILAVVIIGIAIAVGLSMFGAQSVNSNRDAIIADMVELAADAYQYRIRPRILGGGGGSYLGYSIPTTLQSNDNGSFSVSSSAAAQFAITGVSSQGFGTVTATFGSDGRMATAPTFTGQFQ